MECQPIEVVVNGQPRLVERGATVEGLLAQLGIDPARVAVELDRRIVRREAWSARTVEAGARIEIVQFVGGG
ncbi:MAG: sulfur carrier protein ThiS [Bryobacteraceae bacterium]